MRELPSPMRFAITLPLCFLLVFPAFGAMQRKSAKVKKPGIKLGVSGRKIAYSLKGTTRKGRQLFSPWRVPTFANSTTGDETDGENLRIREAAVNALGPRNGTVVVAEADTGR